MRGKTRRRTSATGTSKFLVAGWFVAFGCFSIVTLHPLICCPNESEDLQLQSIAESKTKRKKNINQFRPKQRHRQRITDISVNLEEHLECSCTGSLQKIASCCDRRIIRVHKMGYALISKLFGAHGNIKTSSLPNPVTSSFFDERDVDYRYVVVIRNLYDALISGYLYHKTGHECWKNENGGAMAGRRQRYKGWLQTYDWEKHFVFVHGRIPNQSLSIPSGRDRNLCNYLQDESEEVGLRVYMEFALHKWYRHVQTARQLAQQSRAGSNRTIFVCYEQLVSSPSTRERTMRQILDWLFPGHDQNYVGEAFTGHLISSTDYNSESVDYMGGHATNHDPRLRQHLRNIIQLLDENVFASEIAAIDKTLLCK